MRGEKANTGKGGKNCSYQEKREKYASAKKWLTFHVFWLVKWPKKAHHADAESQNNVIFDVLIYLLIYLLSLTVGRKRAVPSKTAVRRDWKTGFCVATAFAVKRIQRIRNCAWSSANTVVPWQRFVIYCRSVLFTRVISTRKCLFLFFFRKIFKLLYSGYTFELGFHVIVWIDSNPSSSWEDEN